MPKAPTEQPDTLKPYLFHGVNLYGGTVAKEARGDCPFCGRENKFSVNVDTGQWRCFVCDETGNVYTFLRKLWAASYDNTPIKAYMELCADRELMETTTLIEWCVCKSITTNDWLVPGFSVKDGNIVSLYRYMSVNGRMVLIPTPTLGHQLFGVNLYAKDLPTVYLCEGVWDAMCLWEILSKAKTTDKGLAPTASREASFLGESNVLAVPASTVFNKDWCTAFENKSVILMAQNDHPRKHPNTGKLMPPASYVGMERIAGMLDGVADEIQLLTWGKDGYNSSLSSGYDIRDFLNG